MAFLVFAFIISFAMYGIRMWQELKIMEMPPEVPDDNPFQVPWATKHERSEPDFVEHLAFWILVIVCLWWVWDVGGWQVTLGAIWLNAAAFITTFVWRP